MSQPGRRLSQSLTGSWKQDSVPLDTPDADANAWMEYWKTIYAKDLIESLIVSVDADTSVEDACEILLSKNLTCLAIRTPTPESGVASDGSPHIGLFDFSDVNAFLTLAATRHTLLPEDLREQPRVDKIVAAARAGRVPVHLVSNLSEKNMLVALPHDSTVISLLEVFARGSHTVLVQAANEEESHLGLITDRHLLSWFAEYASSTPSLLRYLSNPLSSLALPSIDICSSVVAVTSTSSVLDAMKLMSEAGVSSVAVLDSDTRNLLSAVSVTDIGKIVVPSESNQILGTSIQTFIAQIKANDGSTDGADKYPVYSVSSSHTMMYAMEKLLATNAHRLFVAQDPEIGTTMLPLNVVGNLTGIVSIVDILCLFARAAKIADIDPQRMQRQRRASSSSSQSEFDFFRRSRSSSRTSFKRSPSVSLMASPVIGASNAPGMLPGSVMDVISIGRRASFRKGTRP